MSSSNEQPPPTPSLALPSRGPARPWVLVCFVALVSGACFDPEPSTTAGATEGCNTGGPACGGSTSTGGSVVDTTTDPPGTTTDTPGTTTDTPGTTTGDPPGGCMPSPMDSSCALCVKLNCCTELMECAMDGNAVMGCVCYQQCVVGGAAPGPCGMMCGVDPDDPSMPAGALSLCTLANCNAECL